MPFLKIKVDMFVVYSLTLYSHLKQNVDQCLKKNRVMRILLTQSVTLFFLEFYYPHELESGNTHNKE